MGTHRYYRDGLDQVLPLTNLSDTAFTLDHGPALGWIMAADMVSRYPVYASVGLRRYNEWQTLAFETTTEKEENCHPNTMVRLWNIHHTLRQRTF